MTPSERVLVRLRAMGLEIPEGSRAIRTYAGYWQRKEGCWLWTVEDPRGGPIPIGSQYTMTELLRHPQWRAVREHHDITIYLDTD